MNKHIVFVVLAFTGGLIAGAMCGHHLASTQARIAILSGPYSDNYGPALNAIAMSRKMASGNPDLEKQLSIAQDQIERAKRWTEGYLSSTPSEKGHN